MKEKLRLLFEFERKEDKLENKSKINDKILFSFVSFTIYLAFQPPSSVLLHLLHRTLLQEHKFKFPTR